MNSLNILAIINSLNMFAITSITIYLEPPRFFPTHGSSRTTTLPQNFSMIWKQRIMLMKVRQAGYCDLLPSLSWDGQIFWFGVGIVIWMRYALCTVVSLFWHSLLACVTLNFQLERWLDRTSSSFDKQNISGNAIHNNTGKAWDIIYYNSWTRPCSS